MSLALFPAAVYARCCFFALWAWIGWVDWRYQNIRHRSLGVGVLLVAVGYAWAAYSFAALPGGGGALADFLRVSALNIGLSLAAALFLWWLRMWPAGDSKLFMLLGAFYPVMCLPDASVDKKLFLSTLINIFIPAAVYLFFKSSLYVFQTRVIHRRRFLIQLGWRRELDHYVQSAVRAARGSPEAVARGKELLADPRALLSKAARALLDLAWMTVVSSFIALFVPSPIGMTLCCFLLFYLWGRGGQFLGRGPAEAIRWAAAAAILWSHPMGWHQYLVLFGRMSVFSLFVYLGVNLTLRPLIGGMALLLPFSLPVSGFLVARAVEFLAGHAVPGLARLGILTQASRMALLGLFLGATWLVSKISDERLKFVVVPQQVVRGVMPRGDFLDEVRALDPGFHEAVLGDLYADGLTSEQAKALVKWCRKRSIATIPITPTLSFASWIFLGFFLSWCLGGGHVLEAIF